MGRMKVWNVIETEQELRSIPLDEFIHRGEASHPITFRPYAFLQHRENKEQYILLPMQVEVIENEE